MYDGGEAGVAERALAHALFALRREGTRRGATPLDIRPIGDRLQQALLVMLPGILIHMSNVPPEGLVWSVIDQLVLEDGGQR